MVGVKIPQRWRMGSAVEGFLYSLPLLTGGGASQLARGHTSKPEGDSALYLRVERALPPVLQSITDIQHCPSRNITTRLEHQPLAHPS